jgi:ligand-binding sensor domain-containing protein
VRLIQKTITNQDGTSYTDFVPHCVAEDLDGNIWIGTNVGPFLIEKSKITSQDEPITQVKVARNDGTDLADYLLSGVNITNIVIDGANRKWFGTENNGVYLISADNTEQIHHFTEDNSPLLSNQIKSLAMNPETGELFIGSDIGLCSYMSDATAGVDEMSKDDVYAFPNPVPSDYTGTITVRGLAYNSDVKILTVSGRLVAEGRSNGGTFTWNGRDSAGRRVASGIYMICAAKSDGSNGIVCKIAMVK